MSQKAKRPKKAKGTLKLLGRVLRYLFRFYPVMTPLVMLCILFSAVVSAIPAVFMQQVLEEVGVFMETGDWTAAKDVILPKTFLLASFYILSILSNVTYTQMAAVVTQGFLHKLRVKMFTGMEDLPISYFDQRRHGDIMSLYTNDVDALRQLIGNALPTILSAITVSLTVFIVMLYFSVWMTLVVVVGVIGVLVVTKVVGGRSARFFIRQQKSIGKAEGFVQEMMNGQKVIKVFCHEEKSEADYEKVNDELYQDSYQANRFANMLMPILGNIRNILYVFVAFFGGLFLVTNAENVSLSGLAFGIDIVVPFLNMTQQFTGNISQVSGQINSIVMAAAGAARIFSLLDEQPETDDGYVKLVNVRKEADGTLVECEEHTGNWAWKHPHSADGTITYEELRGDVRLTDVDFSYVPGKPVLRDITVYAKPGQKVAFVGATGAGKTTITNLINRFYDIEDGKIRYDGININKIKRDDLRRSIGIVLQDTNLFTGTVLENIRYGRLEATDEECYAAARLTGAEDFILRLPDGYATQLTGNGANLSQGQRQLLAISRAAVADPPVLIMDEATSSIDTRTEIIVSRGMDSLMEGRTVFVIAHRLSTVQNADVIMVMDHGQIIERGTHDDLIAQHGVYYQLYTGAFELE